ncbi:PilZ domain-containing protein [Candidatus Latescibacterota bacterium]
MRYSVRYFTDIPFEYSISDDHPSVTRNLTNVGHGGLSFRSEECFSLGTVINIRIPLREPAFVAKGVVVWCRECDGAFNVGIMFKDYQTEHAARMVEQVVYIEHYKKEVLHDEGRMISGAEAVSEWISKYPSGLPH